MLKGYSPTRTSTSPHARAPRTVEWAEEPQQPNMVFRRSSSADLPRPLTTNGLQRTPSPPAMTWRGGRKDAGEMREAAAAPRGVEEVGEIWKVKQAPPVEQASPLAQDLGVKHPSARLRSPEVDYLEETRRRINVAHTPHDVAGTPDRSSQRNDDPSPPMAIGSSALSPIPGEQSVFSPLARRNSRALPPVPPGHGLVSEERGQGHALAPASTTPPPRQTPSGLSSESRKLYDDARRRALSSTAHLSQHASVLSPPAVRASGAAHAPPARPFSDPNAGRDVGMDAGSPPWVSKLLAAQGVDDGAEEV
ncbi:hypothetical protein T484DRAFT_1923887 [Baffinella frigidus]|nr:hypothetical protein T484DRAFT_1923887 [Cryptophyta sp. CCMP2293]